MYPSMSIWEITRSGCPRVWPNWFIRRHLHCGRVLVERHVIRSMLHYSNQDSNTKELLLLFARGQCGSFVPVMSAIGHYMPIDSILRTISSYLFIRTNHHLSFIQEKFEKNWIRLVDSWKLIINVCIYKYMTYSIEIIELGELEKLIFVKYIFNV